MPPDAGTSEHALRDVWLQSTTSTITTDGPAHQRVSNMLVLPKSSFIGKEVATEQNSRHSIFPSKCVWQSKLSVYYFYYHIKYAGRDIRAASAPAVEVQTHVQLSLYTADMSHYAGSKDSSGPRDITPSLNCQCQVFSVCVCVCVCVCQQ